MSPENVPPQWHSFRLKDYDYSQPGAYFVTLVIHTRQCILGEIQGETMSLSRTGQVVEIVWGLLPNYFPIQLDEWIIMPNHFHGIIVIEGNGSGRGEAGGNKVSLPQSGPLPPASPLRPNHVTIPVGVDHLAGTVPSSLGSIIQTFKSMTTRKINALHKTPGGIVWQRNYYEHIIRSEEEWARIRLYNQVNPMRWGGYDENPSVIMR